MSFDEEKIKITRLISGEDLLGSVTLEGFTGAYLIEFPFVIGINADPRTSHPTVQLAPFFHLMDEPNLRVDAKAVVFSYKPNADVIEKYKQIYLQMTSGLVLPS